MGQYIGGNLGNNSLNRHETPRGVRRVTAFDKKRENWKAVPDRLHKRSHDYCYNSRPVVVNYLAQSRFEVR